MPNTNRDVYAERLEFDRKIRRHAASLIGELHTVPSQEALALLGEVRAMVRVKEGQALSDPISADAACLYSRLPTQPAAALRTIHLLELWIRYIESGVLDIEASRPVAVIVGAVPLSESPHLRLEAGCGCGCGCGGQPDIVVAPSPRFKLVSGNGS